jgi:hypothetical protein
MSRVPGLGGTGIPRLQELSFLTEAMLVVAANGTYEDVRRRLIEHMTEKRRIEAPTGNHAAFRLAVHNPTRYVDNTSASLGELMKLGFVDKSPLPSNGSAAAAYQARTFEPTGAGRAWAELMGSNDRAARATGMDALLRELWRIHPQFSGYLKLLMDRHIVLPTARWTEAQPAGDSPATGGAARLRYVDFLAARAFGAVEAGVAGWEGSQEEIAGAIRGYLEDRFKAAERRKTGSPYARNRDFVGACEEALVSHAFRQMGTKLDFISLEILRRWTRDLGVANFSYYVPGPPALRLWPTAEFDLDVDGQLRHVQRRTVTEHGDAVVDAIPTAVDQARRHDPDSTWVPIYRVRAAIAIKLGLSDATVDAAIRQFISGDRRADAPFRLNLESAEIGATPPTETPLRVTDARTNRTITYRVMAVVRRSERTTA